MMMKIENIEAQMRKGVLELCVLSIISQEDVYSTDIIEKLRAAELIVVEGTLYPLLSRLKNGELLDYYWEESTSGPPRKYYQLTDKGGEFLQQLSEKWQRLNRAVNFATQKTDNNE